MEWDLLKSLRGLLHPRLYLLEGATLYGTIRAGFWPAAV